MITAFYCCCASVAENNYTLRKIQTMTLSNSWQLEVLQNVSKLKCLLFCYFHWLKVHLYNSFVMPLIYNSSIILFELTIAFLATNLTWKSLSIQWQTHTSHPNPPVHQLDMGLLGETGWHVGGLSMAVCAAQTYLILLWCHNLIALALELLLLFYFICIFLCLCTFEAVSKQMQSLGSFCPLHHHRQSS